MPLSLSLLSDLSGNARAQNKIFPIVAGYCNVDREQLQKKLRNENERNK